MAGTNNAYYDTTGNDSPDNTPSYDWYDSGMPATVEQTPSYDGYTTGQWADPTSSAYDPNMQPTWEDRLASFTSGIGQLGDKVSNWWKGLDDQTKNRILGGAGMAGLAALTAPSGSKWTEATTNTYNAGAAPGFVNMNRKLVRTPVADRKGGNYFTTTYAAKGGVMPGGSSAGQSGGLGFYLGGPTDGMADKVHATIDGNQPARLAHGEFVIPADVVSHLGNGNSDAGAKKLYDMMARIRKARTGNPNQGKEINPDKFLPMMGKSSKGIKSGVPGYADGGVATGITNPNVVSTEQGVSNWAAPYVGDMLSNAQAAANAPYQAYQGPLTAGPSALQTQGFNTASNLQTPAGIGQAANTAGGIGQMAVGAAGNTFDTAAAQKYMNPYLQMSLNPQLDELRRQSGITQVGNDAKMTNAGAFGGDRQALLTAETQRNLQQQQEQTTGNAYNTAFTNAQNQFNADQNRRLQALGVGLQGAQAQGALGTAQNQADINTLNTQLAAGQTQQGLAQADVAANKTAFEQERDNPYKMLEFQKSMLTGLPLTAQGTTTSVPPILQQMAGGAAGGITLADILSGKTGGTTGTK